MWIFEITASHQTTITTKQVAFTSDHDLSVLVSVFIQYLFYWTFKHLLLIIRYWSSICFLGSQQEKHYHSKLVNWIMELMMETIEKNDSNLISHVMLEASAAALDKLFHMDQGTFLSPAQSPLVLLKNFATQVHWLLTATECGMCTWRSRCTICSHIVISIKI